MVPFRLRAAALPLALVTLVLPMDPALGDVTSVFPQCEGIPAITELSTRLFTVTTTLFALQTNGSVSTLPPVPTETVSETFTSTITVSDGETITAESSSEGPASSETTSGPLTVTVTTVPEPVEITTTVCESTESPGETTAGGETISQTPGSSEESIPEPATSSEEIETSGTEEALPTPTTPSEEATTSAAETPSEAVPPGSPSEPAETTSGPEAAETTSTEPACATDARCTPLRRQENTDVYLGLLDSCSLVPPSESQEEGYGVARGTFDPTRRRLRIDVEYVRALNNITSVTLGGPASPGANARDAPTLLTLNPVSEGQVATLVRGSKVLSTRTVQLTRTGAEALYKGLLYVTVATEDAPNGAIRGQLYCAASDCRAAEGVSSTEPAEKFKTESCNPNNGYAFYIRESGCLECA